MSQQIQAIRSRIVRQTLEAQMEHYDEKLSANEAARHLGVAVSTLAKMRCSGGSPRFFKLGARVCYSRADLDEWLHARSIRHTSEAGTLPRRLTDKPRRSKSEGDADAITAASDITQQRFDPAPALVK